jgi:hypothetical protein
LLLVLVRAHVGIWRWIPGLLLFGAGVGVMLTFSVNVVQSSFPDADQGQISGAVPQNHPRKGEGTSREIPHNLAYGTEQPSARTRRFRNGDQYDIGSIQIGQR